MVQLNSAPVTNVYIQGSPSQPKVDPKAELQAAAATLPSILRTLWSTQLRMTSRTAGSWQKRLALVSPVLEQVNASSILA